jgi:small subunit ribosomal protein S17
MGTSKKYVLPYPPLALSTATFPSSNSQNRGMREMGKEIWLTIVMQYFSRRTHLLVHDPRSSLRTGDIISISSGWRTSKQVHHVVNSIIAPFGEPIESRPPVPTEEERLAEREAKKKRKDERKKLRRIAEKTEERSI